MIAAFAGQSLGAVLADGELPFPPSVEDFYLPGLFGLDVWLTKITLLVWVAVAVGGRRGGWRPRLALGRRFRDRGSA